MAPKASLLVSSLGRPDVFRRALWAIAHRPPTVPFEVVVAARSGEGVLDELRLYSSRFEWTFLEVAGGATGLANAALPHLRGELIFEQKGGVIAWGDCYAHMLFDAPVQLPEFAGPRKYWRVVSTTYDLPAQYLGRLDVYGSNLTQATVRQLIRWPLLTPDYQPEGASYLSLVPRAVVEEPGEQEGFKLWVSEGVSIHQPSAPGPAHESVEIINVVSSF